MILSTPKWVGLVGACCLGLLWEINHVLLARLDGPSYSTDQMIASLGVMVTGLGLFIAVAAVGIAVVAILGFSELREMVERRIRQEFEKSEKKLSNEVLALSRKKMLLNDKDEDEKVADLAERVEPTQSQFGSETSKDAGEGQAPEPPESVEKGKAEAGSTIQTAPAMGITELGIPPKGNSSKRESVSDTSAEQPIAGEYPQGKEGEEP
jgi:hypothetical protein